MNRDDVLRALYRYIDGHELGDAADAIMALDKKESDHGMRCELTMELDKKEDKPAIFLNFDKLNHAVNECKKHNTSGYSFTEYERLDKPEYKIEWEERFQDMSNKYKMAIRIDVVEDGILNGHKLMIDFFRSELKALKEEITTELICRPEDSETNIVREAFRKRGV